RSVVPPSRRWTSLAHRRGPTRRRPRDRSCGGRSAGSRSRRQPLPRATRVPSDRLGVDAAPDAGNRRRDRSGGTAPPPYGAWGAPKPCGRQRGMISPTQQALLESLDERWKGTNELLADRMGITIADTD